MTITVQDADGSHYEFPDGTDPAEIKKAMDAHAAKQPPAAAGPPRKPPLSEADRLGTGMLDPVLGTAQLGAHVGDTAALIGTLGAWDPGMSEPMDAWMKQREADIQARTPPPAPRVETTLDPQGRASHTTVGPQMRPGTDPLRTLGNLGSPMTWGTDAAGPALRLLGIAGPKAVTAAPGLLRRMTQGTGRGVLGGAEQPATDPGSYWGEKSMQVGPAAAVGGTIPAIGKGIASLADWAWNWVKSIGKDPADKAYNEALRLIYKRMSDDTEGGGPTFQDMLDILNLTPGKPQTIAHVGGENVLGLVGRLQRQPGATRQGITKWLRDTDAGATTRINADLDAALASDGVSPSQAVQGLRQARSIAAKPLWDKAMAGGSIAPLKQQFQDAYVEVGRAEKEAQRQVSEAQQAITIATAKQHRAGNDVYLVNSANQELRAAQSQLQQAQGELAHQTEVRQLILGMVHEAQADIDADAPGAVWSPRLQQFLSQPEVRSGLQTGIKLEGQKAMTEGRPMNIGEYAIKGYDDNGDAVIGKVPTMKLLASAKEGLDAELEKPQYHDELTGGLNKAGVHLDGMRRAFLEEIDRMNPDYAKARAVWSGDTASMQAVRYGEKQWMNKRPEEIADDLSKMTPGDLEFARLGLAANLRKRMYQKGGSGNEAAAVAGDKPDSWLRQQIKPFFRNEAKYKTFIDSVDAENRIFTKQYEIAGNSRTAARAAEDRSTADADRRAHQVGFAAAASKGYWLPATYHWLKAQSQPKIAEDVAEQIGAIVRDPAKSLQVIGGYKPPLGPSQPISPYLTQPAGVLTSRELGLE